MKDPLQRAVDSQTGSDRFGEVVDAVVNSPKFQRDVQAAGHPMSDKLITLSRTLRSRDVSAAMVEAASELDRLHAIIARLPVTADGVPVVPGMDLWVVSGKSGELLAFKAAGGGNETMILAWPVMFGVSFGFDDMDGVYPPCTYSTRKLAEAARAAAGKGGEA